MFLNIFLYLVNFNRKKSVNVITMSFVSFTVGYPAMINNLAKYASNFPSPEEQITFQLKSQKL